MHLYTKVQLKKTLRVLTFAAPEEASSDSYSASESDPESESSFPDYVTFLRDNCFITV